MQTNRRNRQWHEIILHDQERIQATSAHSFLRKKRTVFVYTVVMFVSTNRYFANSSAWPKIYFGSALVAQDFIMEIYEKVVVCDKYFEQRDLF